MNNLNRFLVLATALWVTAGAANAVERVVNGTFTANAFLFKEFFGMIGYGSNPASIPNWSRSGAATLYTGVEGEATSLSPKNSFGPADYGGRTFAVFQSTTASSLIYQAITLPAGFYKIQYDVAGQNGQAVTYQVVVLSGSTNHYVHSGIANNAAFETVTGYFAGGGGATPMISLQNYTANACTSYTNVSIQDAKPPAPTVSNNTPLSQGATVTLTASSPYTTDSNAFNWNGPALTNFKGNNLSFNGAQPNWSGTYSCTVTVNGVTSDPAYTEVVVTSPITASAGSNGTVSPNGVTNVTYNGSQNYTITPATGYAVATLTVDGSSVTPATSYTFTNVTTTHTITATFHTLYQAWLAANSKPDNEASLKEYAFGTTNTGAISVIDSTHITLGQTPAMQIAGTAVTTVFGRRQNYQEAGLTYTVSFSADLTNWYPSTDTDNLTYAGTPDLNNPAVIASQGDMNAVSIPFPLFIKTAKGYEKTQAFCIIKVIIN